MSKDLPWFRRAEGEFWEFYHLAHLLFNHCCHPSAHVFLKSPVGFIGITEPRVPSSEFCQGLGSKSVLTSYLVLSPFVLLMKTNLLKFINLILVYSYQIRHSNETSMFWWQKHALEFLVFSKSSPFSTWTVIAHLMNSLEITYWEALKKEALLLWEGGWAMAQVSRRGILGDIQ